MASGATAFAIKVIYATEIQIAYNALVAATTLYLENVLGLFGVPKRSPYWDYKRNTSPAERLLYGETPGAQPRDRYPSIDDAFFTVGYTITDYPSLWDMYGKFVAGLDIEVIYEQIYDDMMTSPALGADIAAESALLDDELNRTSYPKLTAGMRDMNAVMSSSFIYGKSLLESDKIKTINKYSAALKMEAMRLTLQRWANHLQWNHNTIEQYVKMQEMFWSSRSAWADTVAKIDSMDKKWPFEVLDFGRAVVGALNGAAAAQQSPAPPKWQQITSNVLGPASMLGGLLSGGK